MDDAEYGLTRAHDSSDLGYDLAICDREPIYVPGSIQPHGLLLVVDRQTRRIVAGAGDIEARLAADWLGADLSALIGEVAPEDAVGGQHGPAVIEVAGRHERFDAVIHEAEGALLVEFEPVSTVPRSASGILSYLDHASAVFGRASDLQGLCDQAATVFRDLTGFDRVMIYRFLDDEAGAVIAESRDPALGSFLNHHFPASDIPKQARALYVRHHVRVIPDVDYVPAPLRPARAGLTGLDMSDLALRSVSPIHVRYLQNMGVGASASISIVKDGLLWGLVACHHRTPRQLSFDTRAACRVLAGGLARQIRAREEAELYRERLRLRAAEDAIAARLAREGMDSELFRASLPDMRKMLDADGFALVQGHQVQSAGGCPPPEAVLDLAAWLQGRSGPDPVATERLSGLYAPAAAFRETASGLLSVTLSSQEPIVFLWFRAEQVEVIEWAGNPHKAVVLTKGDTLSPRASFDAWSETVRGEARPWTLGEVEAAGRLRDAVVKERQNRRLQALNAELTATLADKESLLRQKDYLVKEVNHRVQNSLQLVAAFLAMQARASSDPAVVTGLGEAQRRLSAVALVHRRLYQDDNVEQVDLGRYLEELCEDMRQSMGEEWRDQLHADLAPIPVSADRAVSTGLILTELVINARKYAYGGAPGKISIVLEPYRSSFRLIVADEGQGMQVPEKGFGTRMIGAIVDRLGGTISYDSNDPGLRAILTAAVGASRN
ncbi:histidine kinase dimerization/phosphoacceptor domain -containing protein [Aureimonas glaciei]|uniref:Phytochrome chromophore attachment site domain-containing protein n=1 Tax=Aureimonas glaciei TaxID=1776957 RepID=A0A916Y7B2_9HYPH|nr:histidine kinase dimerization/phosphoacceptor domain -containing protein [Aureimonas glaciei]GGD33373.1 hypothetical protein GCM10011335_40480 [Aureimonas glaciei]